MIRPCDLLDYTIYEFMCAWYGFYNQQALERLKTFYQMTAFSGAGDLIPAKLWALPGEFTKKSGPASKQDIEELKKKAAEKWV